MLSCKDVCRLVTENDHKRLPMLLCLRIKIHYSLCRDCSRFCRQVKILCSAGRMLHRKLHEPLHLPGLSLEARRRILNAMSRSME